MRATPDDIWAAMQVEKLEGFVLSDIIGGGDPKGIAVDQVKLFEKHLGIRPTDSILDVGCGCGRIATGLIDVLGDKGRYAGVDIIPGLVQFAQSRISSSYPNFRFFCRDQANTSYDYYITNDGPEKINSLSEACEDGSADLAIAISLFTHLDFNEAAAILAEIAASLNASGRAYLTFFVLDQDAMIGAAERKIFSFRHQSQSKRAFIDRPEDPTFAVGYTPQQLNDLLEAGGLRLVKRIPGSWCGLSDRETYQDGIIVRRDGIRAKLARWLHM